MHTLTDLIVALNKEVAITQVRNLKTLNAMGLAVALQAKEMIGHDQSFWKPLADSTVERKTTANQGMNGDPTTILYAEGTLKDDINFQVNPPLVSIGTDLPYAEYLENGTSRMPPRPLFEPAFAEAAEKFMPVLHKGYLETFKLRSDEVTD